MLELTSMLRGLGLEITKDTYFEGNDWYYLYARKV